MNPLSSIPAWLDGGGRQSAATARFQNLPLEVSSMDGRNFVLLSDAYYVAENGTRYCLPAGATSDGASTPPAVWALIPPFGLYWPAAYLHDAAYRNTLLVWQDGASPRPSSGAIAPPTPQEMVFPRQPSPGLRPSSPAPAGEESAPAGEGAWIKAALPREKCDALLLEAMAALGVGLMERQTIYEAVVIGGTSSFDQDRKNS